MGFSPQFRLSRKLIKAFFRKRVPQPSSGDKEQITDLINVENRKIERSINAVKNYNRNSSSIEQKDYDLEINDPEFNEVLRLYREKKDLQERMKKLHLDRFVLSQMNKPIYRKHQKGRFKDYSHGIKPHVHTVYDGIKMK